MTPRLSLSDRVAKAATLLSVPAESLTKSLSDNGITNDPNGLALLDADTTTAEDLIEILQIVAPTAKKLQLKAAAGTLKGSDPLTKDVRVIPPPQSDIAALAQSLKPISNWTNEELLAKFVECRDADCEEELDKRAKRKNFVVLMPGKYEPGQEVIDMKTTLDLLRLARKDKVISSIVPVGDKYQQTYRITELNLNDRLIEICPICGEPMFKGYCEDCGVNLSGVGDDERAFMKLVVGSGKFESNSQSDRKALVASAQKGIEDLKESWPGIVKEFDEAKATGNLPKLRIVENRPSTVEDPWFQNGNRSFGNRTV